MESLIREALEAIVQALDVERNRFGKLQSDPRKSAALRHLAVCYKVGGCEDIVDQAVKVARAVLSPAAPEAPQVRRVLYGSEPRWCVILEGLAYPFGSEEVARWTAKRANWMKNEFSGSKNWREIDSEFREVET